MQKTRERKFCIIWPRPESNQNIALQEASLALLERRFALEIRDIAAANAVWKLFRSR